MSEQRDRTNTPEQQEGENTTGRLDRDRTNDWTSMRG